MVDNRRLAPGAGDPAIAEEVRRLLAQLPQQVEESRRRGCLLQLAIGVAITGPFAAIFTGMSGDVVVVLTMLVGSCGLAGLLFAGVSRGIRGSLAVLGLPVIWLVVVVGLVFLIGADDPLPSETAFYLAIFVLIQAACAEAGYLIGRLFARLWSALPERLG